MGKLNGGFFQRVHNDRIRTWVFPLLCGLFLFVLVRPTFDRVSAIDVPEKKNNAEDVISVSVETQADYSRVFYVKNEKKTFISLGKTNSYHPFSRGEYIVFVTEYNGMGQIIRYHEPTNTRLRITRAGTNIKPRVSSDGKVVWEGWEDDQWNIYLFDGTVIRRVTSKAVSKNPDIDGDIIAFSQKLSDGSWQTLSYSFDKNAYTKVATGVRGKFPRVFDGKVFVGDKAVSVQTKNTVVIPEPSETPIPTPDLTVETATPSATPETTPEVSTPSLSPTPEVTPEAIIDELTSSPSGEQSLP